MPGVEPLNDSPAADDEPHTPARPEALDPLQLGFTPREQVRWLSPSLLLRTGVRTALALTFGAYLDKRELQNALPARWHRQQGEDGELWLDYVADLGDGFDATYSVAYLLAQPELTVDGHRLPRGQVLVMGGDLVYPAADMRAYEDRTKGPYTAALPEPPADQPAPTLYALPGNHDWYDGLTAFLRMFAGQRSETIGGWRLEQTRSYFAVELPQRWWLFAVDSSLGSYLDDPQLVYFAQAAKRLRPGDRVILATAEPAWLNPDPSAYDSLDYFVRTVIQPTGAEVAVMVSGDLHHYNRYTGADRELVTCGGGGAYLAATHTLRRRITAPAEHTLVRHASPSRDYRLAATYPDEKTSRRLARGVFFRLPWRNPGFVGLVGVIHALLMLALAGAAENLSTVEERLITIPLTVMLLVVGLGTVGFASVSGGWVSRTRRLTAGLLHGAAHVGLGVAGAWLWVQSPVPELPAPVGLLIALLVYAPVAGLVAGELVALYLLVASRFGINVNELFASQGIENYKSFLRMRIGRDGSLTIYPVAVDRICRRWRAVPTATRPDASAIAPRDPDELRYRLAEPPIVIR